MKTKSDGMTTLPPDTLYWYFVVAYVAFQLISDVTAGKVVSLGAAVVSVTALYFPVTYIISDVLTEVYGYARARRALWAVLACSIIAGVIYQIVVVLPPGPGFQLNAAYAAVLGQVPRILAAGWLAVFSGEIANDYVMSRLKVLTRGHALWLRIILSTVFGQGLNTVIFYFGALYGVLPLPVLEAAIIWGWSIKVAVEVIATPVTYYVVARLKKHEGMDTFDRGVNYNPFRI